MDARLKERLVGAAVLVVIAVWVIPWILDGPDTVPATNANGTADLVLPAETNSAPVRTQTIELEARRDSEQRHDVDDSVSGTGRNESAATKDPVVAANEPQAPLEPNPMPVAAAIPAPAADNGGSQADDIGNAVGDSTEPSWTVQLGSFSDENNARRLAERVLTFGQPAQVSTHRAGGRQMYRVRVDASKTRDEAESKASSLTAHGFVAQVVPVD